MTIKHRAALPADLERLCPLLDNEFVFSKGRKTSLTQRFPSTVCGANAHNIFIAEDRGEIVASFLCKRFEWQQGIQEWSGAMIGGVYTDPGRRGEGIASALLKWGAQALRDGGAEFAVLWTTQADFYAKLGWVDGDVGMFGSGDSGVGGAADLDSVKALPAVFSSERDLDDIRMQYLDAYVCRRSLDYSQLPLPAEGVDVLLWAEDGEPSSYALLGHNGGIGILYEMVGSERGFADLWEAIRRRHQRCVINDSVNSASYRWLSQNTDVSWENKNLAMWLPLSPGLDIATMSNWYIPYFDRI